MLTIIIMLALLIVFGLGAYCLYKIFRKNKLEMKNGQE